MPKKTTVGQTKRVNLEFPDDIITKLGRAVLNDLFKDIDSRISDVVLYELLPPDVLDIISESINERLATRDKSITTLEINLLQAKGDLYSQVRDYVRRHLSEAFEQHLDREK